MKYVEDMLCLIVEDLVSSFCCDIHVEELYSISKVTYLQYIFLFQCAYFFTYFNVEVTLYTCCLSIALSLKYYMVSSFIIHLYLRLLPLIIELKRIYFHVFIFFLNSLLD